MKKQIFKGSATAMITPLTEDGKEINYEAFKNQIDKQIENGTKALVILGTTGEPSTLTKKEKKEIVKFAVHYVNGRVPVIAGAGSNNTKDAVKMSVEYEKLGVDALLHVSPYYNKCTQNGLITHFKKIAEKINIPIIIYNVPGRTGLNILPETVRRLSEIENIAGIKEASGNISQIAEIAKFCNESFSLYSGDDGIILPVLSLGGSGVISVASNVEPYLVSTLCDDYFKGDIESARKKQFLLNPLVSALFSEVNPIPVKSAMKLLGLDTGILRLPLTQIEKVNLEKLKVEMKKLNLI